MCFYLSSEKLCECLVRFSQNIEEEYGEEEYEMDVDLDEFANPVFPPAPTDAEGIATAQANSASNAPRLTADFFSQALDNVLAGRGGEGPSFSNPLASSKFFF